MNNRQKAKHFKQLYEKMLVNRPPVVYKTQPLEHLRVCKAVSKEMMVAAFDYPDLIITEVENAIFKEMKQALKDRIIVEEDIPMLRYVYSLDVWVNKR